jgi:molybdopterin-guanine dinucleotide biosynthesis protein A
VIDPGDITGVILCGGKGRRIGGLDKPLALAGDLSLVERVRSALAPQVGRIIISANQHLQEYARWGDLVVADQQPDLGPLGGLSSALEHITTRYTFCCPGDAPLLSATLVTRLAEALEREDAELAIPDDGERRQHLFVLFKTELRDSLRTFMTQGGRAAHEWNETRRYVLVDDAVERISFTNVNTTVDLELVASLFTPTKVSS